MFDGGDRSATGSEQPREKGIWFIELNAKGEFTLRGGFPRSMMGKDPHLREMEIGRGFPTKEALLQHIDELNFCGEGDVVVMDGDRVVRG